MLLGFVVNLCLFVVGALLINALLIVPAAAAANFCRNLRQLFWCSTGFAVLCGVGGQVLAWEVSTQRFQVGTGGMIVVLTVILFIISMLVGPAWRNRAVSADPQPPEVMKTSQV
jgi:zinc transport system permease protein